jgi:hypothetical protein
MGYRRSLKIPNGVRNRPVVTVTYVGDVVRLQIVEILAHRATVGAATGRALKRSFELCPRFHQPVVAQWHQENRIDLGINLILACSDEVEIPCRAGEDGNWLLRIRRLRGRQTRRQA